MKFPKSMHPEGFYDHLDKTAVEPDPAPAPLKPGLKPTVKAGARPLTGGSQSFLREDTAPPPTAFASAQARRASTAPAASTPVRVERSDTAPWVIGAGIGVLLVAVAVMMSRNLVTHEPVNPPATVVGQASPSAEEAQLQAAPPSAGPATPAPEEAAPTESAKPAVPVAEPRNEPAKPAAPVVEPRTEPAHAVAAAPLVGKPATIVRAAPTTRAPEVVAQAAPRESALQPLPAATPAPEVAPTPVTPPVATPTAPTVVPPVAQTEAQPPVVAPAEDAGITVQVRTALAADTALATVPIAVSTDHGVVKLEGQAPDAQARERATVIASGATGVKAVDNRLTLPPATIVGQAPSGL
jgi:hypothetical protein